MGRTSVIAITQFVFLALGTMALTVLVKAGAVPVSGGFVSGFFKTNGLWLLILPVVWALSANIASRFGSEPLRVAHGIGCFLAAAILFAYAVAILFPAM